MQSQATTVAAYLASLPPDRRAAVEAVLRVVRANLDSTYQEGMSYGMIGWCVPHSVFPAGYHCDPKLPLPFASLASQKGHMALYLMGLYIDADRQEPELARWFREAWTKTGKKLDMGKACIRFKAAEDLALDAVGAVVASTSLEQFVGSARAARKPGRRT